MTTRAEFAAALPPKTAWWRACFEDANRKQQPPHVRQRVEDVGRLLKLENRSRILDLWCGLGQETLEFGRAGHRVLGIDAVEDVFREARAEAKASGLFCHFLKSDLRNVAYTAEFDAVLVRHPHFGQSQKERDDLRTLETIHKALKPNGRLLLKLVNRDWIVRHFALSGHEHGLSFDLATGRLEGYRGPQGCRAPGGFRLYALTEALRLVSAAGLETQQVLGRFDGAPYGLDCFHMIVIAQKPKETPRPRYDDEGLVRALKIKGRGR